MRRGVFGEWVGHTERDPRALQGSRLVKWEKGSRDRSFWKVRNFHLKLGAEIPRGSVGWWSNVGGRRKAEGERRVTDGTGTLKRPFRWRWR